MPDEPTARGRPRDETLDAAILRAAAELLAEVGFEALTFSDVAVRAGTTRPAIYRRHASKIELVVAAIGSLAEATAPRPTGDHLADLTAELASFRDGITSVSGVSMVGAMLHGSVADEVRAAYRRLVVGPRRARIRSILDAARADGSVTAAVPDLEAAVAMSVGSWYAHSLAGDDPGTDWPARTARLVLRSLGGDALVDRGEARGSDAAPRFRPRAPR